MIQLIGLSAGYRAASEAQAVLSVEKLSASAGELVAIIGLNGVGKSTILKTMAGLLTPLNGSVLYSGKNLQSFDRLGLARSVTYIAAGANPEEQFTVEELVSLGRHPHTNWIGKLTPIDRQIVNQALQAVGMHALAGKSLRKISDGERQRAHIARALAQDTPIILLDEPTAFLDVVNRYSITWLLKELCEKQGRTIVFSTHDWNVALHAAHKIWLLLPSGCREGAPEDLAFNGDISELVKNSSLGFDSYSGLITARKIYKGTIDLLLEGPALRWAAHAMDRISYELLVGAARKLTRNGNGDWVLTEPGMEPRVSSSLHQLAAWLQHNRGL